MKNEKNNPKRKVYLLSVKDQDRVAEAQEILEAPTETEAVRKMIRIAYEMLTKMDSDRVPQE